MRVRKAIIGGSALREKEREVWPNVSLMVLLHGRDRWKARNSCSPPFVLLMVRFIMHDTDGTETILSHYSLQTAGPKYFLHTYTCVFVPRLYRWFPILHLITYWVCHSTFATLFFRFFFFLARFLLSSYTYNGMSLKSECRSIRIDGPIFVKLCSAKKGTVRAKSKIHGRDIWLTSWLYW